MKPELLLQCANYAAIIGWIILVIGWFSPVFLRLTQFAAIPLLLSGTYAFIVIGIRPDSGGDFSSLAGVQQLFTNPWVATAGWIHYLAFDLFIGSWQLTDAKRRGISFLLMLPVWFLTFMVGPLGFLLYLVIRLARERSASMLD